MITTPDIRLTAFGERWQAGVEHLYAAEEKQHLLIMSGVRSILRINDRQYYMQPFTFLLHPVEDGGITVESQGATAYRYMVFTLSEAYLEKFRVLGMTTRETHTLAKPLAVEEIWKLLVPVVEGKQNRHKIYLSAFGTTCTQDVIASRIACSKRLLETTDEAITTISQLSGFETDVYFMRQFKRHVGMTPTAYRRINRQSAAKEHLGGR